MRGQAVVLAGSELAYFFRSLARLARPSAKLRRVAAHDFAAGRANGRGTFVYECAYMRGIRH
jgi:hypothetical protein